MINKDYENKKGYYPNFNTLEVGGHKFTLKNCKEVVGHDDTLPYVASLYIDGKKVCTLFNDGWGGETNITQITNQTLLDAANKDVKGLLYPTYPWDANNPLYGKIKIDNVLCIADAIAEFTISIKSAIKKYGAKTSVIAAKGDSLRYVKLKCNASMITENDIKAIEKRSNELIKEGWIILNAPQMYFKQ